MTRKLLSRKQKIRLADVFEKSAIAVLIATLGTTSPIPIGLSMVAYAVLTWCAVALERPGAGR